MTVTDARLVDHYDHIESCDGGSDPNWCADCYPWAVQVEHEDHPGRWDVLDYSARPAWDVAPQTFRTEAEALSRIAVEIADPQGDWTRLRVVEWHSTNATVVDVAQVAAYSKGARRD